jgi:hypothetical protein
MGILQAIALQDQSITTSLGGGLEMTIKKNGSIMLPFFKLSMRFKVPSFKPNRNDY